MSSKLLVNLFVIYCILNYVIASKYNENERKIENKVLVVTGGAQGIGFAIADNFLKNGAKLAIILDINVPKGKEAEIKLKSKYGENKAVFIECDVTKDLNKVSKLIKKKYGYTDILVNSAGILSVTNPRKLLLINAVATIEFSLQYNKLMKKTCGGKGGTIINLASIAGHVIDPFYYIYRASKFAVYGFSQSLGQKYNYKETGVRVLTLCPAPVNTTLGLNLYASLTKAQLDALIEQYRYTLQSPNFIGESAVEIFRNAESGTSWDIENEKPQFPSVKTIRIVKPNL